MSECQQGGKNAHPPARAGDALDERVILAAMSSRDESLGVDLTFTRVLGKLKGRVC